ncbi:MAG: TATA-box-binding protein [Desulfurococcales archaeon]|jgi:transcription initiation factor TFIID TATA-box-binding protein|uniref:TATA-box-binding protein n=1 Tax=Fervidicoccus fontis TaxID=683846 RepID=A0A7J3SMX6_9CREN|nr:TATA-box-binding protein [Thermoprotei archaeon]NAY89127.1 TATA-box-binding protein [Desulfurococcales archaeon]
MPSKSKSGSPSYKIENIVATVTIDQTLDLHEIERRVPRVEYNPDQFPGLVFRLDRPKITALIFKSGKMVVTGSKSTNELINSVRRIIKTFANHGIKISHQAKVQIQNIVASGNLNVGVNLEEAAYKLENIMYEPEQFPGLIYRMTDPLVVLLIFSSGKMVITGAKREEEVEMAVSKIYKTLSELDCLVEEKAEEPTEEFF